MTFQGIGEGCPRAETTIRLPVAVPTKEGERDSAQMMIMNAPVIKGQDAADIPILLGLDSIEGKCGLIQTDPKHRCLTFPGPGGYTIEWAPGAMHIPLHQTPSGHLAFPLDAYDEVKAHVGGVERKPMILHADGPMNSKKEEIPH